MYELTCPACKHQIQLPFLRVGALAVCRACGHRYAIQREHIARLATIPPDTGSPADNPLLLGGTTSKPPPPPRPAPPPEAPPKPPPAEVGVPISVLVAQPPANLELTPIQPILPHQEPSPDVARLIARRRAERMRYRRLIWIGSVFGVFFIVVAVALVTQMVHKNQSVTAVLAEWFGVSDVADGQAPTVMSPVALDLPVAQTDRLSPSFWREVDEVLSLPLPESRVKLVDGRLGPVPGGSETMMYTAGITTNAYEVIELATLHMMLVDKNNRVFARCQMPLMLISAQEVDRRPQPVTVAVPRRLADRTATIATWVQVQQIMNGGAMFSTVLHEPVGKSGLKLTAYNPLGTAMQRAVFHIRAFNKQRETVCRWRVEWTQPIGPRQRVEFVALTPLKEEWDIDDWEVIGAGGRETRAEVDSPTP